MHTPTHTQGKIPMERGGLLLLCLNILASDQVVKRNYKLHSLCHMAICKYLISQKDKRKEGKIGRKEIDTNKASIFNHKTCNQSSLQGDVAQ